jgi:hypothetical protein
MKPTLLIKSILFIIAVLILPASVFKNKNNKRNAVVEKTATIFPVPPKTDLLLFYVQRTPNINTIVYNLNMDENGVLDTDEPVIASWIRYQDNGEIEKLSYIQRKYAYGVVSTLTDAAQGSYSVEFVSYSKRKLLLKKSAVDKKYHIYITINNKTVILNRVFLNIEDGGTFWFPSITSVELKGTNPDTGAEIIEVFKP